MLTRLFFRQYSSTVHWILMDLKLRLVTPLKNEGLASGQNSILSKICKQKTQTLVGSYIYALLCFPYLGIFQKTVNTYGISDNPVSKSLTLLTNPHSYISFTKNVILKKINRGILKLKMILTCWIIFLCFSSDGILFIVLPSLWRFLMCYY